MSDWKLASMRKTQRMTRCECQEVTFRRVLSYARENDVWTLDQICPVVNCGQVCTACHCDLKAYLAENRPDRAWNPDRDLYDLPSLPEPNLAQALVLTPR